MLQFKPAPAHILQIFAEQTNLRIVCDLRPGFLDFLIVDEHLARENQGLRALAGCSQSAIHEKFVESYFQDGICAEGSTQKVPAPAPVQSAKTPVSESLMTILCRFSTDFSTNVLKTSATGCRGKASGLLTRKKAAQDAGGSSLSFATRTIRQLLPV